MLMQSASTIWEGCFTMKIIRKSVAFNLDDPDQFALYAHATKRTNFSAYVKRLIQRDMEGCFNVSNSPVTSVKKDNVSIDADIINSFI